MTLPRTSLDPNAPRPGGHPHSGGMARFVLFAWCLLLLSLPGAPAWAQVSAEEVAIEQALEKFYKNNYDILVSRYEVDKSYADYVGSKLLPNPNLTASRTGMDTSNRLANGDNTQDTIRLDQLIETAGKRGLRISAASETLEASRLAHRDTIRNLLVGFYSLYFSLFQDGLTYDFVREELNRFRRILDIAEKRHNAGFLSLIDYTKLRLSAIDLQNNATIVENSLRNNSEFFGFILGEGKPFRPVRALSTTQTGALTEDALVKTAHENRYDLLALERHSKAADHNLALAKARRIPDVTAGVEWEKYSPNYNQGIGVALSLPLPIFDRRQGEILRRNAEKKQVDLQMNKVKRQIITEIRQALNNYRTSQKVFDVYRQKKIEMDDLLSRTEKSFSLGGITVLELLDTQKTYRDFQVKYNHALAQANLSRELINVYTGTIK